MKLNIRRLVYVYFFLFKKSFKKCFMYTDNFDFLNFNFKLLGLFNKPLYFQSFLKFLTFLNLNSRNFVGKTLDWNTLSSLNDSSLFFFGKKNVILDNFNARFNSFSSLYFIDKKKLNNLGKNSFFLFIGCALRVEEPLLNLVFRRVSVEKSGLFFSIGSRMSSNFYVKHIGSTIKSFFKFITGNHWLVNLYFKSLSAFFLFGQSFSVTKINASFFGEFIKRGFGTRNNDQLFFSGFVPAFLSSMILGFNGSYAGAFAYDKFNPFIFDFSYDSLLSSSSFCDFTMKDRILVCFDHNFNKVNRMVGDLIVPQRSFIEKKDSIFVNVFGEISKNKSSFMRDVDKLFSMLYKKSYDFMVYDSKIVNFGVLRSRIISNKLDSCGRISLRICRFYPLLFFSYEHLYNTIDYFIFRKLILDISLVFNMFVNFFRISFSSNTPLFLNDHYKNGKFISVEWYNTNKNFNLNFLSLINNRVYFDPENDVFSNNSILLLKTYKRLVMQMNNFN